MLLISRRVGDRVCLGDACAIEVASADRRGLVLRVWSAGRASLLSLRLGGSAELAGVRVTYAEPPGRRGRSLALGFVGPRSVPVWRSELLRVERLAEVMAAAGVPEHASQGAAR